jgi:hypothetical protein
MAFSSSGLPLRLLPEAFSEDAVAPVGAQCADLPIQILASGRDPGVANLHDYFAPE